MTQVLSTTLFPISFVDSGSENEDDWEEMGDEEQENSTICLFCEECFRNADNINFGVTVSQDMELISSK